MKLKKCLTASILILGITVLSTTPAMAANIVKRNAAAHRQEQGNWRLDERGWWFEKAGGGYARAEWLRLKGIWYHFDDEGYMQTGWFGENGQHYYTNNLTFI